MTRNLAQNRKKRVIWQAKDTLGVKDLVEQQQKSTTRCGNYY